MFTPQPKVNKYNKISHLVSWYKHPLVLASLEGDESRGEYIFLNDFNCLKGFWPFPPISGNAKSVQKVWFYLSKFYCPWGQEPNPQTTDYFFPSKL